MELVMSVAIYVCLSVCPHVTTQPLMGISWNFIRICFTKIRHNIPVFDKIWQRVNPRFPRGHICFSVRISRVFCEIQKIYFMWHLVLIRPFCVTPDSGGVCAVIIRRILDSTLLVQCTAIKNRALLLCIKWSAGNTGRFIMFFMVTNIYNKKTKGSTLMELFTATGKLKKIFLTIRNVWCVHHGWHDTHRYDIHVLATHASTCVHRYVSLLQ
jgi:hypothetical protein